MSANLIQLQGDIDNLARLIAGLQSQGVSIQTINALNTILNEMRAQVFSLTSKGRTNTNSSVNTCPNGICEYPAFVKKVGELTRQVTSSVEWKNIHLAGTDQARKIDIRNDLKKINEQYGFVVYIVDLSWKVRYLNEFVNESIGDLLLYQTAKLIRNLCIELIGCCEEEILICRDRSGGRFLVLIQKPDKQRSKLAMNHINDQLSKISLHPTVDTQAFFKTFSIGLCDLNSAINLHLTSRTIKKKRIDPALSLHIWLMTKARLELQIWLASDKLHFINQTDQRVKNRFLDLIPPNERKVYKEALIIQNEFGRNIMERPAEEHLWQCLFQLWLFQLEEHNKNDPDSIKTKCRIRYLKDTMDFMFPNRSQTSLRAIK